MTETDGKPGGARLDAYFTVSLRVAERVARGDAGAAIAMLRREIERTAGAGAAEPEGSSFLYALLAVCHARSGDPEGALAVLEEMERVLPGDAATALRLAEGYLLLLGEAAKARAWARRARSLAGDGSEPALVERRSRAMALEGRAAFEAGDREAALALLGEAELPDPDLAQALLDAGAPAETIGEILARGAPRHEAHERSGAAASARSDEVRRLLARIATGRGGGRDGEPPHGTGAGGARDRDRRDGGRAHQSGAAGGGGASGRNGAGGPGGAAP